MNNSSTAAVLIVLLYIAIAALYLFAGARILKKSGQSGWKILIPIYGMYCLYKAADSEGIFWGMIVISVVSYSLGMVLAGAGAAQVYSIISILMSIILFIMNCVYCSNMSKSFGKSSGFTVGLILLFPIFFLILAFGSAEHYNSRSSYGNYESSSYLTGTWKCKSCGAENPNSRGTCQQCGAVKADYTTSVGAWKCKSCGAENPNSRGTCMECGAVK